MSAPPLPKHSSSLPPTPHTRHLDILIVDDEPAVRRMFRTVLCDYGFWCEEANGAERALDLLKQKSFDVVITDISMPGRDGLDFLRVARARNPRTPIIVMTGKPSVESSRRAAEWGAFRYLIKPIMPATLKRTIADAVGGLLDR